VIQTVQALEDRLSHITTPMTLSVIGCVVNGPGEARETDLGLTGGGKGVHQVYMAGVPHHRLRDKSVVDHLVEMVEKKAEEIEAALLDANDDPAVADEGTKSAKSIAAAS
jgi:(E)-4-hydroxy-3-methylbut-2-enyl-diphosphate synthase